MFFCCTIVIFFFFKQKTAYEMRISDLSSDVCSSDLVDRPALSRRAARAARQHGAGDGPGLRPGAARARAAPGRAGHAVLRRRQRRRRSEEHTSELQSLMRISYAVFCLKKKKNKTLHNKKKHD